MTHPAPLASWLIALLVAPLAACDDAPASRQASGPAAGTSPSLSSPSSPSSPSGRAAAGSAPAPATPPPPDPADSCRWKATGDVAIDTVGRGGMMAVSTSHWEPPVGKGPGMFSGHDGAQINCNGDGGSVTFAIETEPGEFPMGPGRYEIVSAPKGKPRVVVLGTVKDHSLMRSEGYLEVTAYDARHIAGRFELKSFLLPGDGTTTVSGEFTFRCPGLPGCGK